MKGQEKTSKVQAGRLQGKTAQEQSKRMKGQEKTS